MSREIRNFIDAFEVKCEEKGTKPSKVYRKVNISRSSYSDYKLKITPIPKERAVLLTFGLKPTLEEMQNLLSILGEALLPESKHEDRLVAEAINNKSYDIDELLEKLSELKGYRQMETGKIKRKTRKSPSNRQLYLKKIKENLADLDEKEIKRVLDFVLEIANG